MANGHWSSGMDARWSPHWSTPMPAMTADLFDLAAQV